MLDIKFIRENPDLVKEGARKKHIDIDIDRLLDLDKQRVELQQQIEEKRTTQNEASKQIATASETDRAAMIESVSVIKKEIQELEEQQKPITDEWKALMLQVPSVPHESVPEGKDDTDNVQVKQWGEQTEFDFEPKSHIEIMENLKMADFERGSKVHGFRGYFLTGAGAELSWAIWNYANSFFMNRGFIPFIPPMIVRENIMYGTGYLPNDADDIYRTQDEEYLVGTAEVPLMGYHQGEVLDANDLPLKYLGFSPCYRREAGSYGKDTKGLIRVNEFFKVEQVIISSNSHEESVALHEDLNKNTEEFIESLGIPYQTVANCGGDLGQGQIKKYDIELWVPGEKKYREISSASYFHDFQTRRLNIRYRDADGEMKYTYSLNCTAAPTPRLLVSLIENYQNADGTITIPEALRPYMGGKELIS